MACWIAALPSPFVGALLAAPVGRRATTGVRNTIAARRATGHAGLAPYPQIFNTFNNFRQPRQFPGDNKPLSHRNAPGALWAAVGVRAVKEFGQ